MNGGLRNKYGVDMDGTEALWRPVTGPGSSGRYGEEQEGSDAMAEAARRRDVAARRVTSFVRMCVAHARVGSLGGGGLLARVLGGGGAAVVDKDVAEANAAAVLKARTRRERREARATKAAEEEEEASGGGHAKKPKKAGRRSSFSKDLKTARASLHETAPAEGSACGYMQKLSTGTFRRSWQTR